MENICHSPDTAVKRASTADRGNNSALSRRAFIRYLTVGAAAIAVEGCGGGAASGSDANPASPVPSNPVTPAPPTPAVPAPVPSTPAPAPSAPQPAPVETIVWQTIPAISFTQGVAGTFSVADYISVANAALLSVTLNSATLPAGVTFDSATRAFHYDGSGKAAAIDGVVLTAIAS